MKLKLKKILVLIAFLITSLFGYQHGGNLLHPAAPLPVSGDVYIYIAAGATYVTASNLVNVATARITLITTNVLEVNAGDTNLSVSMSVRNTGTAPMTITSAEIRMYTQEFSNIVFGDPSNYLVNANYPAAFSNQASPVGGLPVIVAAGNTVTLNFRIDANNNPDFESARSNPLVLDGYVRVAALPADDDWWVNAAVFTGQYQYAADVTANWDTSGPPYVLSVQVSPNPANATLVTVTVNFSEYMDTTIAASINYNTNGITYDIDPVDITGWFDNYTWVGTFNIPADMSAVYDGIATLAALAATDNAGNAMTASYNIGTFEIDTIRPTASLVIDVTANAGAPFTVVLYTTDYRPLGDTPNIAISVNTTLGEVNVPVNFATSIAGVTWNGNVLIPATAIINTTATFNVLSAYLDTARNTNNVLVGRVTVNIADPIPVITTVNFDTVPAYNDMTISSEPYISVFILDYRQIGLDAASVRVSVDGALAYSGPPAIYQVAASPNYIWRFDFSYPGSLSVGRHFFEFGLDDVSGNAAVPFIVTVNVVSTDLEVADGPTPFPNPFSPDGDGYRDVTYIVYNLTKSEDITIYIYNLNSELIWKRRINRGEEGAHAGINAVLWNGEASFGGGTLPNGIYICHIIAELDSEKRSLGRTKIYILK